ncbi:ankyrin repeat domain-containing protein [Candidatus Dependentiae bacterium]
MRGFLRISIFFVAFFVSYVSFGMRGVGSFRGSFKPDPTAGTYATHPIFKLLQGPETKMRLLRKHGFLAVRSGDWAKLREVLVAYSMAYKKYCKYYVKHNLVFYLRLDYLRKDLLEEACRRNKLGIVKHLFDMWGLSPNSQNLDGELPIICAIKFGSKEVATYLCSLSRLAVNARDGWDLLTPLCCAAIFADVAVAKDLLKRKDLGVNLKARGGYTPLHYAAMHNNVEIVKALLDDGRTDINVKTDRGYMPIHYAAMYGNVAIFKLLFEKQRLDVNALYEFYIPPKNKIARLLECICRGKSKKISLLDLVTLDSKDFRHNPIARFKKKKKYLAENRGSLGERKKKIKEYLGALSVPDQ